MNGILLPTYIIPTYVIRTVYDLMNLNIVYISNYKIVYYNF